MDAIAQSERRGTDGGKLDQFKIFVINALYSSICYFPDLIVTGMTYKQQVISVLSNISTHFTCLLKHKEL